MESEYLILKKITPEVRNTYFVPKGYFDEFASSVLFKIVSTKPTYTIPSNYFDQLSNSILSKISAEINDVTEELKDIAPLLSSIDKNNVYQSPEGYFDNLAHPISTAKIVSFKSKTLFKYAIAAVFIGLISFAGYKLLDKSSIITTTDVQASIQKLPDVLLANAVNEDKFSSLQIDESAEILLIQNLSDINEEIKYIPDQEMEAYINDNNIVDEVNSSSNS